MLILVLLISALLFAAVLVSLGFRPALLTRFTGSMLAVAAAAGVAFYGYGYAMLLGDIPQAVIRTLFAVFCMFLGRNDLGTISKVAPLGAPWMQVLIYAVHLFALYCSASALISTLGTNLLRRLNLLLVRRGDLHLIYGISEATLDFAEALQKRRPGAFVFVGTPGQYEERILHMGAIAFSDAEAKKAGAAFLRRLGLASGSRKLSVCCLGEDAGDNGRFAAQLLESLGAAGVTPDRTSLSLLAEDEEAGGAFQAQPERYGYGSVFSAERHGLLARLLVRKWPPSRWMRFDGDGRAEEDFHALIVGFGPTGQAVLRALVMNGQFAGSRFHATVIDLNHSKAAGSFFARFPALADQYDVSYLDADAHSVAAFERLRELAPKLNYAVIAAGSREENDKIAAEYRAFLARNGCRAPLLMACEHAVRASGEAQEASLYDPAILSTDAMDTTAMVLNHQYHLGEGGTAREDWEHCDYFSRMSCRASADCADSFLAAAHTTRERVLAEGLELTGAQLENLSQTEHLRWCAFHYAMGYLPMPEEIFDQRADAFRRGELRGKPGKDPENRMHACLTDWDALDDLSRREQEKTGREVDYKELDRDNIRLLPEILRAARELEGKA